MVSYYSHSNVRFLDEDECFKVDVLKRGPTFPFFPCTDINLGAFAETKFKVYHIFAN